MKHILRCQVCNKYTLKEKCTCGGKAVRVKPPKYSPKDSYAKYRILAKETERKEQKMIK